MCCLLKSIQLPNFFFVFKFFSIFGFCYIQAVADMDFCFRISLTNQSWATPFIPFYWI